MDNIFHFYKPPRSECARARVRVQAKWCGTARARYPAIVRRTCSDAITLRHALTMPTFPGEGITDGRVFLFNL